MIYSSNESVISHYFMQNQDSAVLTRLLENIGEHSESIYSIISTTVSHGNNRVFESMVYDFARNIKDATALFEILRKGKVSAEELADIVYDMLE